MRNFYNTSKSVNSSCRKQNTHSISTEYQANLYLQLSQLEESGFSALQAFALLKNTNHKLHSQLQQLQRYLKSGNTIADSGYRAGIFNASDKNLLQVGEASGSLAITYKQLAKYYGQKAKRSKKIKSQCYLPIVILIVALFVQPLPAFILNEISGLEYLVVSAGRFLKIALLFYIFFKLPFWLIHGGLQFIGIGNLVYRLQIKLPFISKWIITRQINEFFRSLGLMLSAGLPILDALPKAINTISNPFLRAQFNSVVLDTREGVSLNDALSKISAIDKQSIQLLLAGEKSGKLAGTILHLNKIESEKIDLQEDSLAEWIPRIFYVLVSAWVAEAIISSDTVGTQLL